MVSTKKYKHVEDLLEDYLDLKNEISELPQQYDKINEKLKRLNEGRTTADKFPADEAQEFYRIFSQQQKLQEHQQELEEEFAEVGAILRDFLKFIDGTVEYSRKEDTEKNKVSYHFWLEDEEIKSIR